MNIHTQEVLIRPLRWRDTRAYMKLRYIIEQEAKHLVPENGERKNANFSVLLRMFLNRKRAKVFVAEDGGALVGYISLLFAKFKKLKGNAYLTVSVRMSHQGRGVGTKLMKHAEQFAKEKGIRRVELEVFGKNPAIKLYERLGYEKEGVRRKAIHDAGTFDDIIFMAKFL